MKKLKGKEVDKTIIEKYRSNSLKRGANAHIYDALSELEIGEALEIIDNEWIGYTKPSTSVHGVTHLRARGKKYPEYTYALSDLGRKFIGKRFTTRKIEGGYVFIRTEDRECRKIFLDVVERYDNFRKTWQEETDSSK